MKKIYIALAVLATAALTSCVQEKSFNGLTPVGENGIAFTIGGSATRSAEEGESYAMKGITISLGNIDGESINLEETIEELNPSPATRGVPAYTQNVGKLYKDQLGVYAEEFGDACFATDAVAGEGWRYTHYYGSKDPWPADKDVPVDFYFRMPVVEDLAMTGVTNLVNAEKKTTFKFTSPYTGKEQSDILFSQVSVSKNQHDGYLPNGTPVLMYHALTGVKFRNGHSNENETKTIITKVVFKNLYDKGDCTVDLAAAEKVQWPADKLGMTLGTFTQEFENATFDTTLDDVKNNPDGTVGSGEGYDADHTWNSDFNNTSWTSAASDKNLNDKDGSLTFWFIPQKIRNNVTLEVTFLIKTKDTPEGTEITHSIEFGKLLNEGRENAVEWKAGQLRTYTLKPFDVDVEIKDKMTADTKSDLHIANTGNVDEYVRLLIMGNWYGWQPGTTEEQMKSTEPTILVGYAYKGDEAELASLSDEAKAEKMREMVLPWYREGYDLDNNPATPNVDPYGHFDTTFSLGNLGDRDGKMKDWADASGGFYYTAKVGPGEGTLTTASATKDLFGSYKLDNTPKIYLPYANGREAAVGVHLVMEIVVQAIAVPTVKVDGVEKDVWWLEAWYRATGIEKLHPNDMKDGEYRNKTYRNLYLAGEYTGQVADEIPIE
jgi:hypothetical protein